MADKPKVNSAGEKELSKVQDQFERFDAQVKAMTVDEMNKAPVTEFDPQVKISNREANKQDAQYLKPFKSIECRVAFNEKVRSKWEYEKQYVKSVVENIEIRGEMVEVWTKPFAGVPYEFWQVPVNKSIMIPRHLAKQLSTRRYHRLVMEQSVATSSDDMGTYYGAIAAKETINRIDCRPVGENIFSTAI